MAENRSAIQRPKAETFRIDDLVDEFAKGRIRIPGFQRRFRWDERDIERLFESIERGYPIGTLLLWRRPAPAEVLHLGALQIDAPAMDEAYWVVDGQQRLTSLASVLLASDDPETPRPFRLYYDLEEERFRRPPQQREGEGPYDLLMPLSVAYDQRRVLRWLFERQLPESVVDTATGLTKALREYLVPAYVVETGDEEQLRDIFDRLNNYGRRLKRNEVFNALHQATEGEETFDLRWLQSVLSELGWGSIEEDTLLLCVLAVRGGDVLRDFHGEFEEGEDRRAVFETAREAAGRAVAFLGELGVVHVRLLPYQYLLVALTAFFARHPAPHDRTKVLLRRWFWRAALLGPGARGGYTAALRQHSSAAVNADEHAAAQAMLALVRTDRDPKGLVREVPNSPYRLRNATSRMAMIALGRRQPRDLRTGELIDLGEALEQLGPGAVERVVQIEHELAPLPANRVFVAARDDVDDPGGTDEPGRWILDCDDDVILGSQLVSRPARDALRAEKQDVFLVERDAELGRYLVPFFLGAAEFGSDDRPPLDVLVVDDD